MKRQEAVDFVVSELSKHHTRDEIVSTLCTNLSMPWADAEKFVRQVQAEHGQAIAVKQSPLLVVMAIVGLIGGCVMFAYGAIYFVDLFFFMGTKHSTVETGLAAVNVARRGWIRLSAVGGGLALMGGSVLGMWQTIKSIFKK